MAHPAHPAHPGRTGLQKDVYIVVGYQNANYRAIKLAEYCNNNCKQGYIVGQE